jgi:hypothetical protein
MSYRNKRVYFIALLVYFFQLNISVAQDLERYAHNALAEKIYLQLDANVYTNNQTIWYKCLVTNAIDHVPTSLSGVLYVELINEKEELIEQKLIPIKEGMGKGYFVLSEHYAAGHYLVRAYTEWNKNFGTDFIFEEYIRIFESTSKENLQPIRNVLLINKETEHSRIQAILDPIVIDSAHKKKLHLFIEIDNKKDSILLKKNKSNTYDLDYPLPPNSQLVTLFMRSKNNYTFSKTIAIDEDYLDLQFFPESGELIHGIPSKIGFKALDYIGKGKSVSGEIIDQFGNSIAFFESHPKGMGMGIFTLPKVDSNIIYQAKLKTKDKMGFTRVIPLPKVSPIGNVLSIAKVKDKIHIQASSNYLKSDSISIRAACRGKGLFDIKGKLDKGNLIFALDANTLPEGIIAFSLMDNMGQMTAHRLFFNARSNARLNIKAKTNQSIYKQREKTRLELDILDGKGKPTKANLSLLVINKAQLGNIQNSRENILSYFLLSSDLKGEIENPSFYFTNNRLKNHQLDALMLTQGWRKYHYTRPIGSLTFEPETALKVSGQVTGLFSKKIKKNIGLTMATFGPTKTFHATTTDSLGRFEFNLDEAYGQKLNILIQSAKKSGKNSDYTITLDEKQIPPIDFQLVKTIENVDSSIHYLVEKKQERKKFKDAAVLSEGAITLDEVVVSDYKLTPKRKKVIEDYGKPDIVIEGTELEKKEEKWSYGLYSVIQFNYPELIEIRRFPNFLYAEVQNSLGPTLVVIDGRAVPFFDYDLIPNIPTNSVSSFEIIKNSKAFRSHYLDVFPHVHPLDAPGFGNIIAIYTYAGKGLSGAVRTVGMFKAAIPVFSPPYDFYAPQHFNTQPDDWYRPDLRALLHWEPIIETTKNGKANAAFYNADNLGEMQVILEAISEKGEIGYKELFYEVIEQEKVGN